MNLLGAVLKWIAVEVSEEVKKRDREIEKLKTALEGAQAENRALWEVTDFDTGWRAGVKMEREWNAGRGPRPDLESGRPAV